MYTLTLHISSSPLLRVMQRQNFEGVGGGQRTAGFGRFTYGWPPLAPSIYRSPEYQDFRYTAHSTHCGRHRGKFAGTALCMCALPLYPASLDLEDISASLQPRLLPSLPRFFYETGWEIRLAPRRKPEISRFTRVAGARRSNRLAYFLI